MSQKTRFKNRELVILLKKDKLVEDSLSEKVRKIINKIPDKNLTLSEIVNLLGNDGLLIFSALLSIIFLIPVSIPGLSTVFGIIIFFIGWSYLLNKRFWLPQNIKTKTLSADKLRTTLQKGLKWFQFIEKISKPHRFNALTNNKIVNRFNIFFVLVASIFLMFPLGFLPFSNTLPALIILFLSIGIIQKDGIIIIIGYFSVLGTLIYFGIFFSSIFLAINKIIEPLTI